DLEEPGRYLLLLAVCILLEPYAAEDIVDVEGELLLVEALRVLLPDRFSEDRAKVLVAGDEANGRLDPAELSVRIAFQPGQPRLHVSLFPEQLLRVSSALAIEQEIVQPRDERPSRGREFLRIEEQELGFHVVPERAGDEGRVRPRLAVDSLCAHLGCG